MEETIDVINESLEAVESIAENTAAIHSETSENVIFTSFLIFAIAFLAIVIVQGLILTFTNLPRLYIRMPRNFDRTLIAFANVLKKIEVFLSENSFGYIVKGYPAEGYGDYPTESVPLTVFMKNSIARVHFLDGPGDIVCCGNEGLGVGLKPCPNPKWAYKTEKEELDDKKPEYGRLYILHKDYTLDNIIKGIMSYRPYINDCNPKLKRACFDVIFLVNPKAKIKFEDELKKNFMKQYNFYDATSSAEELNSLYNFYEPVVVRNCDELKKVLLEKNEDAKSITGTDEEFTIDSVAYIINKMQRNPFELSYIEK